MYHQTLPLPEEIETEVILKLDPEALFSYLSTNTDANQRAFRPSFWSRFDHYFYQDVFKVAAKYGSYDLLEAMIRMYPIDTHLINEIRMKFIAEGDYNGMLLFGDSHGRLYTDILASAFRDHDTETILDYSDYIDAVMPTLPFDDFSWTINTPGLGETDLQKMVALALVKAKRMDDFSLFQRLYVDHINDILWDRGGRDEHEGVAFYDVLIAYVDYETYQELKSLNEDDYDYHEIYFIRNPEIITDPQLYMYIYQMKKDDYDNLHKAHPNWHSRTINEYYWILEHGFTLKPEDWLRLVEDLEERDQIIDAAIANAYDHGYEHFARTLESQL